MVGIKDKSKPLIADKIIFKFMPGIIQINIYKEKNYYHASGLNVPIVTQGKNFEDLTKNIKEAVKLYLDFKRSEFFYGISSA